MFAAIDVLEERVHALAMCRAIHGGP